VSPGVTQFSFLTRSVRSVQHAIKSSVKATFEVFTAVKIHVEIFWVVTACNDMVWYQRFRGPSSGEMEGRMDLWNVGILPQHYTASQHRRTRGEHSVSVSSPALPS